MFPHRATGLDQRIGLKQDAVDKLLTALKTELSPGEQAEVFEALDELFLNTSGSLPNSDAIATNFHLQKRPYFLPPSNAVTQALFAKHGRVPTLFAARLIKDWSDSATHNMSGLLHRGVAEYFGGKYRQPRGTSTWTEAVHDAFPTLGKLVAKAIYQSAQVAMKSIFRSVRASHYPLVRGASYIIASSITDPKNPLSDAYWREFHRANPGGKVLLTRMPLRPLNSFSANYGAALDFALAYNINLFSFQTQFAIHIAAVPPERIFSWGQHILGAPGREAEVLVIGRPIDKWKDEAIPTYWGVTMPGAKPGAMVFDPDKAIKAGTAFEYPDNLEEIELFIPLRTASEVIRHVPAADDE